MNGATTAAVTLQIEIEKSWDGNVRETERSNGRISVSHGRWQWTLIVNGETYAAYDRRRDAVAAAKTLQADAQHRNALHAAAASKGGAQ